jgi:serine/threonine protein kinase/HEAT repeat protein
MPADESLQEQKTKLYSPEAERLVEAKDASPAPDAGGQPAVPSKIAHYDVLAVIGQGGMGTVYRVYDAELKKELAIKLIRPDLATDQTALKRFEQESRALAEMNHPNIVAVFSNGKTADGAPYVVMDYIDGQNLSSAIRSEGPLGIERATSLFIEICDALHYSHEKGIIHRDLKPSNIILSNSGTNPESVRVVDFGIAKVLKKTDGETVTGLTQVGDIFGSPTYMSPEQCQGEKLDARSDIYSLGCMMFEVLTGAPPFVEANPFKLMTKHVKERPPMLAAKIVSRGFADVVAKCLEKRPEDRYENIDQLTQDLVSIKNGKTPEHASTRAKAKPQDWTKKNRIIALIAAAIGIYFALPKAPPQIAGTNVVPVLQAPSFLMPVPAVDAIDVNPKPVVEKPSIPSANLPPPLKPVEWKETPLSKEERSQLRTLLYNVTPTNQATLTPILKMGRRALPALLEDVRSSDQGLARAASIILSRSGTDALPHLIEIFKTDSGKFVAMAIQQTKQPGLLALATLLNDGDAEIRARAVSAISETHTALPPDINYALMNILLNDDSALVREKAVLYGFSDLTGKQVLKYSALNDPSPLVRKASGEMLVRIVDNSGDTSKETLDALGWIIQHDSSDDVKEALLFPLKNINREFAPYVRSAYQSSNNEGVRTDILSMAHNPSLGELILPEIIAALGENKTRWMAITDLSSLGGKARSALPRLRELEQEMRARDNTYEAKRAADAIKSIER